MTVPGGPSRPQATAFLCAGCAGLRTRSHVRSRSSLFLCVFRILTSAFQLPSPSHGGVERVVYVTLDRDVSHGQRRGGAKSYAANGRWGCAATTVS